VHREPGTGAMLTGRRDLRVGRLKDWTPEQRPASGDWGASRHVLEVVKGEARSRTRGLVSSRFLDLESWVRL